MAVHNNFSTNSLQLITHVPIKPGSFPIDYNSKILSLGSCFAVNMAEKFDYFKFRHAVNPFGILFHPTAIANFLGFAADEKEFTDADIFFHNERWHCFDAHSDLSGDRQDLLSRLQQAAIQTKDFLGEATHVIITLGTAWAYRYKGSGNLVANCHKVPQKEFLKTLLSIEEIVESLRQIIERTSSINAHAKIIFTISPVRHLKDGFVENQRSKAHLIAALHRLFDDDHLLSADYFPSYEITMDELRDYRFYAADLVHPSQTAIDYIWEKFVAAWISPDAVPIISEVDAIQKALAHRAFNPDSDSHRNFQKATRDKAEMLRQKFPHIVF